MLNFEDGATGVGSSLRGHKKGKNPVGYTATPVVHVDPKSTYVLHVSVWLLAPPRDGSPAKVSLVYHTGSAVLCVCARAESRSC